MPRVSGNGVYELAMNKEYKVITFDEYMDMDNDDEGRNGVLLNIYHVPARMMTDFARRNDNVKNNRQLCRRCDGTGNRFLNMYQTCPDCGGTGVENPTT